MTWFVRYKCGCSDDAKRKRDLLEYCGKHGEDAVEWLHFPRHTSTGPDEPDAIDHGEDPDDDTWMDV